MTLKIDDSVKQQAIKLRAEGNTYASIVAALSEYGATERWVRRVTKGVSKQPTPTQEAVRAIYDLAIRPCGVKQAECHEIFYEVFGSVWDEEQKKWTMNLKQSGKSYIRSEVKKMAEKNGKVANFVPDWMSIDFPEASRDRMNAYEDHIRSVLQETIADYVAEFDCCDESTVEHELLSRIVKGYSKEPVGRRMKRINTAVNTLVANREKHALRGLQGVTEVLTDEEGGRTS